MKEKSKSHDKTWQPVIFLAHLKQFTTHGLYGIVQRKSVQFEPCDTISPLYPVMYRIVSSESVIILYG